MGKKLITTIMTSLVLSATIAKAQDNQEIISVCKQKKNTYARINTSFSLDEKYQTFFKTEEKETGEIYILTKFAKVKDETEQLALMDLRYYNIVYKGNYGTWNMWENVKKGESKITFLNEGNPLIIRMFFPGVQEQTYYFNIDNLGNGTMTMVSTRWNSPMSSFNNQALYYAECSRK